MIFHVDAMCSTDVADLAVEAVYRLYYHVLRDDDVLESILTHCLQKVTSNHRFIEDIFTSKM